MFNPAVSPRGDQYIYQGLSNAGNVLSDSLQKALQQYLQSKQENAFGSDMMQYLANQKRPDGTPYVPVEALRKYEAANSSTKAGILRSAQTQYAMDQARRSTEAEVALHNAQANRLEAQAQNLWAGGTDEGQNFTPTQEQIQQGRDVGQVWLPTGPNQGRWIEDPNNPVNMGGDVDLRNVAGKDLGGGNVVLYDTNSGKLLPPNKILRPNLVQAAGSQNALGVPAPAKAIPPTSTSSPAPPGKVRVKAPDGKTYFIPAEQLQQALARGLTVAP